MQWIIIASANVDVEAWKPHLQEFGIGPLELIVHLAVDELGPLG